MASTPSAATGASVHPAASFFREAPPGRVFINAAYMSPKPAAALDAMQRTVSRLASPDFGADEFFEPAERVRALLAQVVGGASERISLTGAASYGMATLAWNLRLNAKALVGARRKILGVEGQFPSNVQIWRRLERDGFQFELVPAGAQATERLLHALDAQTALVAFAPLSWTDGLRIDIRAVCVAARERGALSFMDMTQSLGVDDALPADLPVDVAVGAGYKWLLGPYGTGFMRLTVELQEALEPLEASWKNFAGAADFNRLTEYESDFASPAAKFDHGESSAFIRLAGWEAGLQALIEIEPREVARHAWTFYDHVHAALDLERFEISERDPLRQAGHLFRVAPRNAEEFEPLSAALAAAGVAVSRRNGGWRLSPHVYNTQADAAAFVAALG